MHPLRNNPPQAPGRFARGAVVLVTLNVPREKFWGAILELTAAGLSVRGIDLNSFDDVVGQIRSGEPVMPGAVFFPMHRVERIELDLRHGPIPSLSDRFAAKTGLEAAEMLGSAPQATIEVGCTLLEAERRFIEATLESLHHDIGETARILGVPEERIRMVLAHTPGSVGGGS